MKMIRGVKIVSEQSKSEKDYVELTLKNLRKVLEKMKYKCDFVIMKSPTEYILMPRLKSSRGVHCRINSTDSSVLIQDTHSKKPIAEKYQRVLPKVLIETVDILISQGILEEEKQVIFNPLFNAKTLYKLTTGYYLEPDGEVVEDDTKMPTKEVKKQEETFEVSFEIISKFSGRDIKTFTTTPTRFYHDISKAIIECEPPCDIYITTKNHGYGGYSYILKGRKPDSPRFVKMERANYNIPVHKEKKRYLKCLDEKWGSYKFYNIWHEQDGTTHVEYGRLGANSNDRYAYNTYQYQGKMYWIKYYEKIAKGYQDYTASKESETFITTQPKIKQTNANFPNEAYEKLYTFLDKARTGYLERRMSNENLNQVTMRDVLQARKYLLAMSKCTEVEKFNNYLKQVLLLIPRRILDVSREFATDTSEFQTILDREEDLLKAIEPNFIQESHEQEVQKNVKIMNPLDCKITKPTDAEYQFVMKHVSERAKRNGMKVEEIYKITDTKAGKNFNPKNLKTKYLWHGSRTENWQSIIKNGLMINPTVKVITIGSMFGDGLYFAPDSYKSFGYTSCRNAYWTHSNAVYGVLALCEVATGNPYYPDYAYTRFNEKWLLELGYDSVWAKASRVHLQNDEVITYNNNQSVIRYIVIVSC